MSKTSKKPLKILHRLALTTIAFLAAGAAATPVLAATKVIEVDTGAAAIIATFAILLLSIIFEVWRFSSQGKIVGDFRQGKQWRGMPND